MGKKRWVFLLSAVVCMLWAAPKAVLAADTEYDLNQNREITITQENSHAVSGNYSWLKYKPNKDGYLTVKTAAPLGAPGPSTGYLTLYNSTKSTPLSSKSIFYNTAHAQNPFWNEFTFGLRSGMTYYIRVKGDNAVTLSYTFKKTKDTSGDTKAKAKSIKKNKQKTGLMLAGVTDTNWYRLTLKKAQKLRIYYNAKTSGSFKITVYSSNQQIGSRNIYYTSGQRKLVYYQYLRKGNKTTGLAAGTYYIKIEKVNSASSGYYEIKWN